MLLTNRNKQWLRHIFNDKWIIYRVRREHYKQIYRISHTRYQDSQISLIYEYYNNLLYSNLYYGLIYLVRTCSILKHCIKSGVIKYNIYGGRRQTIDGSY